MSLFCVPYIKDINIVSIALFIVAIWYLGMEFTVYAATVLAAPVLMAIRFLRSYEKGDKRYDPSSKSYM